MRNFNQITKQFFLIALAICVFAPKAFAPPLIYQSQSQEMGPTAAQPGQTSAVPVTYSTNYQINGHLNITFMLKKNDQRPNFNEFCMT